MKSWLCFCGSELIGSNLNPDARILLDATLFQMVNGRSVGMLLPYEIDFPVVAQVTSKETVIQDRRAVLQKFYHPVF